MTAIEAGLLSSIDYRDPVTPVIYLNVPAGKVVLFQGFFELYEGLGLVRTLDMRKNLLCVITTVSQLEDCCNALNGFRAEVEWEPAAIPTDQEKDRYLGYFKNAKDNS